MQCVQPLSEPPRPRGCEAVARLRAPAKCRVATQRSHRFGSLKNAPAFLLLVKTFRYNNAPRTKTLPTQKRSRYKNAPEIDMYMLQYKNAPDAKMLPIQKRSRDKNTPRKKGFIKLKRKQKRSVEF